MSGWEYAGIETYPRARETDPSTSHEAARVVKEGNSALVHEIKRAITLHGPKTQFQLASYIGARHPARWTEATIRSACARAGLEECGETTNSRGRRVKLWRLADGTLDE